MEEYINQNKLAWEYDVYDFWLKQVGDPNDKAKTIMSNPERELKCYAKYFDSYEKVKIAVICGSCGKKAVPLALLGADVTVFDISEGNKRYAMELAKAADVNLNYVLGDVLELDTSLYHNYFDVIFMEGGVLHYFHDINAFMEIMHTILKQNGKMICSDFHPLTKIMDVLGTQQPTMDYFSTDIFEAEMAHARFYEDHIRAKMPKCKLRKYTISEIINAVIENGFLIKRFDEHPAWENKMVPGEFTIIATEK